MKILYFAVHEQNAPWGAECFVSDAFKQLGHEMICIDYRNHRDDIIDIYKSLPKDYDFLFLQRGDMFPLEILEMETKPKLFWSSELFTRCEDQYRLLESGLFDHIFMRTDTCRNLALSNFKVPLEKTSILLSGFDPNFYKPNGAIPKKYPVMFFGSITRRRQEYLQELQKYVDFYYSNKLFGENLVRALQESFIVLNIHSDNVLDTETTVYEVLGTGPLLITEKLSDESPFVNGQHLIECNDLYEMVAKIYQYLRNIEDLNEIAYDGCYEVHSKHTYLDRAKQIINEADKLL